MHVHLMSSIYMDSIVYCPKVSSAPHFGGAAACGGKTMVLLIEKTLFLWWMLAALAVVRWFHMLSAHAKVEDPDTLASEEIEVERARAAGKAA